MAHILELLSENTMMVQGIPIGYSSPNTLTDKSTKIMKGKSENYFHFFLWKYFCLYEIFVINKMFLNLTSSEIFFRKSRWLQYSTANSYVCCSPHSWQEYYLYESSLSFHWMIRNLIFQILLMLALVFSLKNILFPDQG